MKKLHVYIRCADAWRFSERAKMFHFRLEKSEEFENIFRRTGTAGRVSGTISVNLGRIKKTQLRAALAF
jgi:hypothetical protein